MIELAWIAAAIWFGVCCVAQLPVGSQLVTGRLVPGWAFFGPRPPDRDIHILVRDEFESGRTTPWREISLTRTAATPLQPRRSPRRSNKAAEQAAGALIAFGSAGGNRAAYETMLRLIAADVQPPESQRRFLIATATFDGPQRSVLVQYVSFSHNSLRGALCR